MHTKLQRILLNQVLLRRGAEIVARAAGSGVPWGSDKELVGSTGDINGETWAVATQRSEAAVKGRGLADSRKQHRHGEEASVEL